MSSEGPAVRVIQEYLQGKEAELAVAKGYKEEAEASLATHTSACSTLENECKELCQELEQLGGIPSV